MGGLGSGRFRWKRDRTLNDVLSIDIAFLKKQGLLSQQCKAEIAWIIDDETRYSVTYLFSGNEAILSYTVSRNGEEPTPRRDRILFDKTKCNFGGSRLWFLCPTCGKNARKIYLVGDRFECRGCSGLPYRSQSESERDRLVRRADKLRSKIGAAPGWGNEIYDEDKPAHMRWDTFDRISNEIASIEEQVAAYLMRTILKRVR